MVMQNLNYNNKDKMIGIGVITHERPKHIEFVLECIRHTTSGDFKVFIYDDSIKKKGIAYGKNQCLEGLKGCDHIFLFDDDCFPKKVGWTDYFINSGYKHLLYMNKDYGIFAQNEDVFYCANASGVFMYLTKEVFDKVGYFNPAYGRFGFEHAGYSKRIFNAGFTLTNFQVLHKTSEYIYALDIDGTKGYEFLKHESTVTGAERRKCIDENDPIYIAETTSKQIYYDK